MAADKRQMVLFSGGGYHYRGYKGFLMDEWLLGLTGKANPRVCMLTTPQGDSDKEMTAALKHLNGRCQVSWAPMFNPLPDGCDPLEELLSADLIYLPGGYAQGAVGAIKSAGWDLVLREAWENGTLIAGMCAGAMTFCHQYVNRWMNKPGTGEGLGFIPVSFTAHAQHRLYEALGSLFRHAIRDGTMEAGYQLQDGFCLRFSGTELVECVTVDPAEARGWLIEPTGHEEIIEHELYAESLEERLLPGVDPKSSDFDEQLHAMDAKSRRRLVVTPRSRARSPLDGPDRTTASIASPHSVDEGPEGSAAHAGPGGDPAAQQD